MAHLTPTHQLLVGDNRTLIKTLPDNSIDAIITDPPYGLTVGKGVAAKALLQAWLAETELEVQGSGFMNRKWDSFVPQPSLWRECLRVLKPGGHLLAFGGPRTYDLVVLGLRLAEFELRDQLQWVYGCGMNKVGYIKAETGEHVVQGWAGALRPGYEPIAVARKPLVGTLAKNLAELGVGAFNIDACRVEQDGSGPSRWPSNFLHDGSPGVVAMFPTAPGQLAPTRGDQAPMGNKIYGAMKHGSESRPPRQDSDLSAARFFYSPKASQMDRNEGLPGRNPHVTVKPTGLMRWLCRLVTPCGGTVLDPFAGSGSTGKAAILEGFNFIGFELDPEYAATATLRLAYAAQAKGQLNLALEDLPPAA